MELNVISFASAKKGSPVIVSQEVFGEDFNEGLVHQVVTSFLAKARQGTVKQKSRSEVSGGGAKPWRQKGTGRARAGTTRGPLWRTGGVTFAARPRDYNKKVNRKEYRKAIRGILSELVRREALIVVDDLTMKAPKTSELVSKLKKLAINDALIVVNEVNEALYLSARNIPHIDIVDVRGINPYSLLRAEKVVISQDALKSIEEAVA